MFVTATGVAKRWALEKRDQKDPLPSYLAKFKEDRVSEACSCIVTAATNTSTITSTRTLTDITTVWALTVLVPMLIPGDFNSDRP